MKQCENHLQESVWGYVRIENCLLKALQATENLVEASALESIRAKVQEISNMETAIECIQFFLFSLINQLQNTRQTVQIHVDKEDYQNLENAVQKSEAEIRKHIRLEQELKIYTDSLEEKVECLQKEIEMESKKYHQLFESVKVMDFEKRELKKKLRNLEMKSKGSEEKDFRSYCHTASKFLTESNESSKKGISKMDNERAKRVKVRSLIEKSREKKIVQVLQIVEGYHKEIDDEIDVSLAQSPGKSKGDVRKNQSKNVDTIQLRKGSEKESIKLIKYAANQKVVAPNRREIRSNSVCN